MFQDRDTFVKDRSEGAKQRFFLAPVQIAGLTALGVAFWFLAATIVRIGSPLGMFNSVARVMAFVAALPIGWLSVLIIIKVTHLSVEQIVPGISLGLGIATFCDGLAITWASPLYGTDPSQIVPGAAWILWGVCTFTAAAFLETYRRSAKLH